MTAATSLFSNTNTTAYFGYHDAPAVVPFNSLPVTRVDGAIERLLGPEPQQQPQIAPFRRFVDRTITAIKRQFEPENLRYNLKCMGIVLAAIAVLILINALTAGILAPMFLCIAEVGIILGLEFSLFLVPTSLALSIWAAIVIGMKIHDVRRPAPPVNTDNATPLPLRSRYKNTPIPAEGYNNIEFKFLANIRELHDDLQDIAQRSAEPWPLPDSDIRTLVHMIKEVDDLSTLASGNQEFERARSDLIDYLNRNRSTNFINRIRGYANQEDKIALLRLKGALFSKDTDQNDALEQLSELIQDYHMEEAVPDYFKHELTQISEHLSDQLPQLLKKLRELIPESYHKIVLRTDIDDDHDKLQFQNNQGETITETSYQKLVDQLHSVEMIFRVLSVSPPSRVPGQAEEIKAIYTNIRNPLVMLKASPTDANPAKLWAIRPIMRKVQRFWMYRDIPLKMAELSLVDITCPISFDNWEDIAPTVENADQIIHCPTANKFYSRTSLERHAMRPNHPYRLPMLDCPITTKPLHIMDTYPLSDMINAIDFTLSAILPETLPMDFMPSSQVPG